ncbi:DUF6545 domain-containing protein [Nocardia sp. NPDC049149]|uniref:DUF6545 domain-containing protein n=1 Tax=Nocardia sp. NPDC049149 TaxID=3364315 RepID=UPI003719D048
MSFMLPTAVTLPLVVTAWLLLAIRLARLRITLVDRRFNVVLALLTGIATTHETTLRRLITVLTAGYLEGGLIYQLGVVGFMFTTAATLLLVAAVVKSPYSPVLVYGIACACCAIALLVGGVAKGPNPEAIYHQAGWGQFGFWLALAPLSYWVAWFLARTCLTEIRRQPDRRDRLLHTLVLAVACIAFPVLSAALAASALRASGCENWLTHAQLVLDREAIWGQVFGVLVIGAVPVLSWLLDLTGFDALSRHRKRLLPLWFELTTACPEIVHRTATPVAADQGRYLLHRMVIEILDSARILAGYATPAPQRLQDEIIATTSRGPERDALCAAVRLVRACAAKKGGASPSVVGAGPLCTGDSLLTEATQLSAIAAQLPRARALAGGAAVTV